MAILYRIDSKIPNYLTLWLLFQVPGAPPLDIVAAPDSSISLNITWSIIRADQRYGIILSYNMKYKRTDGKGVEKELIAYAQSTLLLGLAESVEYDIAVAGMTSKGIGVYSPKISVATGEDGKRCHIDK